MLDLKAIIVPSRKALRIAYRRHAFIDRWDCVYVAKLIVSERGELEWGFEQQFLFKSKFENRRQFIKKLVARYKCKVIRKDVVYKNKEVLELDISFRREELFN